MNSSPPMTLWDQGGGKGPHNRGVQIFEEFSAFHRDNPRVWRRFQALVFELIAKGYTCFGSNIIVGKIRWDEAVETVAADGLKINNNFHPWYARMFVLKHPAHAEFFKLRRLTSIDRPPHGRSEFVRHSGPPGGEEDELQGRLKQLVEDLS